MQVQETLQDLDKVLGIKREFNDPYNIFVSLSSLVNIREPNVPVYVYQLGKEKNVYWLEVNKTSMEVYELNSCKYSLDQLNQMLNIWKSQGYIYTANSVANKITGTMNKYLYNKPYDPLTDQNGKNINMGPVKTKRIINKDTYRDYKYYLGMVEGRIQPVTQELYDIKEFYDSKYNSFALEFTYEEYLDILRKAVEEYEHQVNLFDYKENVQQQAINVALAVYQYLDNLQPADRQCPNLKECIESGGAIELCDAYIFTGSDLT